MATGDGDYVVRLRDGRTGQLIRTLAGHERDVWGLSFSRTGTLLASSSGDHTVRLWDTETGECRAILRDHTGWVQSVAFHPDGTLLASASQDRTIRLWDVASTRKGENNSALMTLSGHLDRVTSVAFSPKTGLLASASVDETIRLWNVQTGECLHVVRIPGPYAGMNIIGARGITLAQRVALKTLGAVEVVDD